MDTGSRLKLVRQRHQLSQRELARRSGVTNATISLIEQNRVSPSVSSLNKPMCSAPRRNPTWVATACACC
jgi:transcriptional regulator with XRE-family HTH domain